MLDGWKNGRLGSKHVEEQRKSSEELKLFKRGEGLKRQRKKKRNGGFILAHKQQIHNLVPRVCITLFSFTACNGKPQ